MAEIPTLFNAATHFIDRHLEEGRGDTVAIECGDERVTHRQLAEGANRAGNMFRSLGVRAEERVALILLDTPDFARCFFGAIKAGAVAVPVNTLWKAADYQYVLNDARARVLVISEPLLPEFRKIPRASLPWLEHVLVSGTAADGLTALSDHLAGASPDLEPAPTSKDEAAFWLYSSGSTGFPKGCVHLHHDMVVCAECYAKGVLGIRESDRCYSVPKLFFAYGLGNGLYFPLAVGATAILNPGPSAPAAVYETIERHRPTLFFSVPTGFAMMLSHQRDGGGDFDLSSVRHAVSAGEALPPAIFERFRTRFGVEILDGIGSTETLHMFISNRPGAARAGSSGQVIPGYEARIVDEAQRDVPPGEIGNLLIRGDSICALYWNQHEKTKATIEGHWIRTGDKYTRDADGYFWYAGRTDDMLKVGGLWVSPTEVENVIVQHDAVRECAVVGREDDDRLVKPCAFVVLRDPALAGEAMGRELQTFVRTRLAEYKRPRWVEFLADLPRTPTGKLQRYKLRKT